MNTFSPFARHSLILSLFIASMTACSHSEDRKPNPPKAVPPFEPVLPFKPVKMKDNTDHPGYTLYVKQCYQCHQQAHPATLTVEKWKNSIPRMAQHAGISQADGKEILDYILHMKSQRVD